MLSTVFVNPNFLSKLNYALKKPSVFADESMISYRIYRHQKSSSLSALHFQAP